MTQKRKKMTDDQLLAITTLWIDDANSFLDEKVAPARAKALRYYRGDNPDNLPLMDGRSKMVSTDVRDVIEWVMPDLMRVFTGGDKFVSIEPHDEADAESAELAEEWVNYVMMRANPGFMNTYTWIKDALLQKTGFQKVYWKVDQSVEEETYEGLGVEDLELLKEAEDFELLSVTEIERVVEDPFTGDAVTVKTYTVTGNLVTEEATLTEECLPPEEVLFLEDAKSIPHGCGFVGHKSEKTISELREAGFDVDDDLVGPELEGGSANWSEQEWERRASDSSSMTDAEIAATQADPSLKKVWVYELYCKLDYDRDGIAEWVMVTQVGRKILEVTKINSASIYMLTPIIMPHRAVGLSLGDLVTDLQELMTALHRSILDHVYQTANPQREVVLPNFTEDTLDALLDNRIGGNIPVKAPGTINPLVPPPLDPSTLSLVEMWHGTRENRTGVTRYNQGMDANSLNKTASGIYQIMSKAAARVELIARIFAETGFKDKIRGILDLSVRYPEYTGERQIRLSGKMMNITSEALKGRYDLVVNPGIGMGNKDQMQQHLLTLLDVHQRLFAAGLGEGQTEKAMVTIDNIYNTVAELIKNMGYRNTSDFISDPNDPNVQRAQVQPPQPPPEVLAEQEKGKVTMAVAQGKTTVELEKAKMEFEKDRGDREIKMRELSIKERELDLKARELEIKEYDVGRRIRQDLEGEKDTRKSA